MELLVEESFLGNTLMAWTISAVIFVIVILFLKALRHFVRRKFSISILLGVVVVLSIHIASAPLSLHGTISKVLNSATTLAILLQIAIWGTHLLDRALQDFLRRREARSGKPDHSLLTILPTARLLGRLVLYSIIALLALANFGVDITALLAGLGVGGIAIALAVQNILGDLFSSLSIVLDKPFEVGDTVQVQGVTGVVERIGLKTTRLRSVSGEQIIFSNSQILSQQIQNLKRLTERRGLCRIGLTYETSPQDLRRVPELLRQCVERFVPRVRLDRASFVAFGPSSLDFELSFFSQSALGSDLTQVTEDIYFEIFETLGREGLRFAYPTQTLYVKKSD